MALNHELSHARARMIRYRILKILDAGRPYPVGEGLIGDILVDIDLDATQMEIRRALQYLRDIQFVDLTDERGQPWMASLLPAGIDYLENTRLTQPGIARPEEM